jgi:hypothetical protein
MNMKIWNAVSRPPATALKTIEAGRLRNKSDINPQWRYQQMTEQFGPCGIGWKYTIEKLWTEPGADGEVFAFALVNVCVRDGYHWSDPIPGIGGHKLQEKEKGGIHNNDEGYKMATTDVLSVALKMLGVAAEIYLGNWDGSQYRAAPISDNDDANQPPPQKAKEPPKKAFEWKNASSAERCGYVLAAIKDASTMPTLNALDKLNDIKSKVKDGAMKPEDHAKVAMAISNETRDVVLAAIICIRQMPDPVAALNLLGAITVKPMHYNIADRAVIEAAVKKADQDVNVECKAINT